MKFIVKNIHSKLVSAQIPRDMEFENESPTECLEDISPATVIQAVYPYLKDPIGIQFTRTSPYTSGTPITEMELFTYDGYLLMTFERVSDNA